MPILSRYGLTCVPNGVGWWWFGVQHELEAIFVLRFLRSSDVLSTNVCISDRTQERDQWWCSRPPSVCLSVAKLRISGDSALFC